jgi:hypothetical protein
VVGQLTAFVWGEQRPAPSASVDARRHVEIAGISGPVAAGAHPAPTPPVDKRSAVAHYRALADQVAREQRRTGVAGRQAQGMAHHA